MDKSNLSIDKELLGLYYCECMNLFHDLYNLFNKIKNRQIFDENYAQLKTIVEKYDYILFYENANIFKELIQISNTFEYPFKIFSNMVTYCGENEDDLVFYYMRFLNSLESYVVWIETGNFVKISKRLGIDKI